MNNPTSFFQRQREQIGDTYFLEAFGYRLFCVFSPAARFSTSAIRIATRALLDHFDLEPTFQNPQPLKRQIGGVARADRPCRIRYQRLQ